MERNKLEPRKLYTSKKIIELYSYKYFQDLVASGQVEWVQDDSFGNRLYRVNV